LVATALRRLVDHTHRGSQSFLSPNEVGAPSFQS